MVSKGGKGLEEEGRIGEREEGIDMGEEQLEDREMLEGFKQIGERSEGEGGQSGEGLIGVRERVRGGESSMGAFIGAVAAQSSGFWLRRGSRLWGGRKLLMS